MVPGLPPMRASCALSRSTLPLLRHGSEALIQRSRLAVLLLTIVTAQPAHAATDWNLTAGIWKDQLADLYLADAARRFCGGGESAALKSTMRSTIAGLEQALGASPTSGAKAERLSELGLVAQNGGRKRFCANSSLMKQANAVLLVMQARLAAAGPKPSPSNTPAVQPPLNPTMLTPVVDPDIALIRGCRTAAIARTGRARADSQRFWAQYERCVSEQGAGWY